MVHMVQYINYTEYGNKLVNSAGQSKTPKATRDAHC